MIKRDDISYTYTFTIFKILFEGHLIQFFPYISPLFYPVKLKFLLPQLHQAHVQLLLEFLQ